MAITAGLWSIVNTLFGDRTPKVTVNQSFSESVAEAKTDFTASVEEAMNEVKDELKESFDEMKQDLK